MYGAIFYSDINLLNDSRKSNYGKQFYVLLIIIS